MGDLTGMLKFLKGTRKDLEDISGKLDKIQLYFNNNFSNVNQVRNVEIEFLQDEFFKDQSQFPKEVSGLFKKHTKKEESKFDKNLKKLEQEWAKLESRMKHLNKNRLKFFNRVKGENVNLDKKEEKLKDKIAKYEEEIVIFNSRIEELNSGFGFMTNLFSMRKIQKKKDGLIDKRDSLIEEIEVIRTKWDNATVMHRKEEKDRPGRME